MESNCTTHKKEVIFVSTKVKKIRPWTPQEDRILIEIAKKFQFRNWNEIASFLHNRSGIQCSARFKRIQAGIIKGPWTAEEDEVLLKLHTTFGKNWSLISKYMLTRTGKQIRDRFMNALDKNINKEKFTPEEDEIILKCYTKYGSCWSLISKKLSGRTGDMIKNRFYSSLRRVVHHEEYSQFLTKKREKKTRQNLMRNNSLKRNIIRRKKRRVIIGTKIKNNIVENNCVEKNITDHEDNSPRNFIISQCKDDPEKTLLQFNINNLNNMPRNNNPQLFVNFGDSQLCQFIKILTEKQIKDGINHIDLETQLCILNTLQTRTEVKMNSSHSK